jgi:proteic killer suppression protein
MIGNLTKRLNLSPGLLITRKPKKIWNGIPSRKLPGEIQNVARRKLRMINNAQIINDLRIPPANHLEKLSGKLEGYYCIKQWRIIFKWKNNTAFKAQIVDYH